MFVKILMDFLRWRLVHPATDLNYEIAWVDATDRCLMGRFLSLIYGIFYFPWWNPHHSSTYTSTTAAISAEKVISSIYLKWWGKMYIVQPLYRKKKFPAMLAHNIAFTLCGDTQTAWIYLSSIQMYAKTSIDLVCFLELFCCPKSAHWITLAPPL